MKRRKCPGCGKRYDLYLTGWQSFLVAIGLKKAPLCPDPHEWSVVVLKFHSGNTGIFAVHERYLSTFPHTQGEVFVRTIRADLDYYRAQEIARKFA